MHYRMQRKKSVERVHLGSDCFAIVFRGRRFLAPLYFRIATGIDELSGFEPFVTVWLVAGRFGDLRQCRDKTRRRVPADW